MDEGYEWLKHVADRMNDDVARGAAAEPERLTVRELLQRFQYQKRSKWIKGYIGRLLRRLRLHTDPDFRLAPLGSEIAIELDPGTPPVRPDPTRRVGALDAARRKPTSVKPESLLEEATTKMRFHDYSQLPVMKTDREVVGMVTWKSIGMRLSSRKECTHVSQCMEDAEIVRGETRLLDAVPRVSKHGYVLVRSRDRTISGIVTTADLIDELGQVAGPFLLLGEIEDHLRNLIHGKFTRDQLRNTVRDAAGDERSIEGPTDLTFGGYLQLLGNRDNWERLGLHIDRKEFIAKLEKVREIRNAIMHFDPDGLSDDDRQTVRKAARFFDNLARMTHS